LYVAPAARSAVTERSEFGAYCEAKWQYGRRYGNRLIFAAELLTCLRTHGSLKPEHENQVRPLLGLTPDGPECRTHWVQIAPNVCNICPLKSKKLQSSVNHGNPGLTWIKS